MAQYLISIPSLIQNARILDSIAKASGAKVVLALKAFSFWPAFPYLAPHLSGCCASGIWEAKLSHQRFRKETLTYSPAYTAQDIAELLEISTHLDFNSLSQWRMFRAQCLAHCRAQAGEIHFGLRINPLHSTGRTPLYDPCAPNSRLGVTADQLISAHSTEDDFAELTGISTLHLHTLCEQPLEDLQSTMAVVEKDFGPLLRNPQITHLNLGGGHWITKPDYERKTLITLLKRLHLEYGVQIWLEPGEAVAIHSGTLRATVLDTFCSQGIHQVILDISATCHLPDVLEMPYRPAIYLVDTAGSPSGPSVTLPGETYSPAGESGPYLHRIGGASCLAGDVLGDYAFARPLKIGDTLVFDDMAHYTFVKSTFFNGISHPDLALLNENGHVEVIRKFDYLDFESRLG